MNLKINKLRTLAKLLDSNASHAILFFVTDSKIEVFANLVGCFICFAFRAIKKQIRLCRNPNVLVFFKADIDLCKGDIPSCYVFTLAPS